MPLAILANRSVDARASCPASDRRNSGRIVVGLVNNMPDSALESTVTQFSRLLGVAAGPHSVELRIGYLPEVPRAAETLEHLGHAYWPIDELLGQPLDGLIVTGLEPNSSRLTDEPYWRRLEQLLDWAESNTLSSIWSCLAAHAAVQILDGIERRRLEEKRFGVFPHPALNAHPLAWGLCAPLRTPHSRWNELPVAELRRAGYTVVSSSRENGADLFLKQGHSLLVFFQGHPEYEEATLFKEYRRDVGRFLRGEQSRYPTLPCGYLTAEATTLLNEFRVRALIEPSPDLLTSFPADAASACLKNTWGGMAVTIYRNWLSLIAAAKRAQCAQVSLRLRCRRR